MCNQTLNKSQGTDICVSVQQMDHRTDCWIPWTNLTISNMDRIVVGSDWFHYFIIVCNIESIPVD